MGFRTWSLVIVLMGTSCAGPQTSPGAVGLNAPDPPALEGANLRRLQLSSLILASEADDIDPVDRAAAAAELLSLWLPQSRELVLESIASGRPEVTLAVLTAMRDEPRVDPAFRTALLTLLPTVSPDSRTVLAEVLARYGQQNASLLSDVSALAASPEATPEARRAAVQAIGSFRHAPAAAAASLMELVAETDTPESVRLEAMTQLSRLTGLPSDQSVDWWLGWWNANRDRPSERWLQDTVDALTRQTAELQRSLAEAEAKRAAMAWRILMTYQTFWPLQSIEQQQSHLTELLEDDLETIRLFGLERLAVLLRDGHSASAAQAKAIALLGSKTPEIRREVAALLPELDPTLVEGVLANHYQTETDLQTRAALLPLVATRAPELISTSELTEMLAAESTRRAALDAARLLLISSDAEKNAAIMESLQPDLRSLHASAPSVRTAELLGLVGNEDDLALLANGLDQADAKWKETVAAALLRRNYTEALIARASDPSIYPSALTAARSAAGLDALQKVAQLTPPEQHRERWVQSLLEETRELELADRLAADEILKSLAVYISEAQRASVLQEAWAAGPPDEASYRLDLARRIAQLELGAGNPQAVVAVLNQIPAGQLDDELTQLKFDAAIRGRLYDDAAAIHGEPDIWVIAFESLQNSQPEVADLVRMEIVRRFQDALDTTLRERLDLAADPLMGEATPESEGS
ncbi:MAG: hypothetical protein MK100_01725 [Phycisphaerales bacterium]|nr:hypothetical protein [Phycisphaerales bacterium]